MATKRLHRGRWEYTIRRKGLLPKPVYLRFDSEDEGDAQVRRIEALLDHGLIPVELAEHADAISVLREMLARWQTTATLSSADNAILLALTKRVGDVRIATVSARWAWQWVQSLRQERLAPSTIRHYVGAMRRCYDWFLLGGESALVSTNPFHALPKRYATGHGVDDTERDRRLVGDEEARIRAVLAGAKHANRQRPLELHHRAELAAFFTLALETAMRMREMYTLEIAQADLKRRTAFLEKTKNGDKRQVPLSSTAVDALRETCGGRSRGLVFPFWSGDAKDLARTTSKLSRQFGRIFEHAGCNDLVFHDLRHEGTSRLFEKTSLSDLQIAKITGHKDLRMLQRYTNLRGSDLAKFLW